MTRRPNLPTPERPFANGTEERAWQAAWCDLCTRDHDMHSGDGPGCELYLEGAVIAGEPGWRWPEAWLPEPDDGRHFLPSRMTCAQFEPCHIGNCSGDPGATERAERVSEVTAYWQAQR